MSLETIRFEHLDLKEGMTLLDLGCGEGRHTLSAALTAPIHAVGLDMSRRDLTTASNRCNDFESLHKRKARPHSSREMALAYPLLMQPLIESSAQRS